MSQMQHARSNFYTRKRIERAHDGLWARGAAVGNTVIGYKRRPTLPATETEPAKGPFYDEIDEEKAVVIREVFERIAGGETAAEVGEWLDSIKVAKAKWSRQAKWTAGNVNAIIRRTIYRGFETFRKKKAKRKLRTGKSEYVPGSGRAAAASPRGQEPLASLISRRLSSSIGSPISCRRRGSTGTGQPEAGVAVEPNLGFGSDRPRRQGPWMALLP